MSAVARGSGDVSAPDGAPARAREITIRLVVPGGDGSWRVLSPGSERASAVEETRAAAEARASAILRNMGGGELRVCRDDRTVEAAVHVAGAFTGSRRDRGVYRRPRGNLEG
jgi:hypothetical protein